MPETDARSGRELRLLLLVILVAIFALLLLARFRFPEAAERTPVAPPPGPLDRIAERASFADLARIITTVSEQISPAFVTIELADAPPAAAPGRQGAAKPAARGRDAAGRESSPETIAVVPVTRQAALRVSVDRALVFLPANKHIVGVAGIATSVPELVTDPARPLALVRVPASQPVNSVLATGVETFSGLGYVTLVEGARGGPSMRPLFVGRVDQGTHPSWPDVVWFVGGNADVAAGSLLFALDGRLIGMAVQQPDGVFVVPAGVLTAVVNSLLGSKSGS